MGRYRRSYNSAAHEAALRHIKAYNSLSRFLGPIVDDVKAAFFSLSRDQLSNLFERYRSEYGYSAFNYASKTYPKWKAGDVQLSGQVAERLVNLVPRYFTTEQRFEMAEKLCEHHEPRERHEIYIDVENPSEGIEKLKVAFSRLTTLPALKYLPSGVIETIHWLHENDIIAARAILGAFDRSRAESIVPYATAELDQLLAELSYIDSVTVHKEIEIGKSKIIVHLYRRKPSLFDRIKSVFG